MYFYHEGYFDACYIDAALEDLRSRDRRDDDPIFEPIRVPAILNWLVVVSVALCIAFTAISVLS